MHGSRYTIVVKNNVLNIILSLSSPSASYHFEGRLFDFCLIADVKLTQLPAEKMKIQNILLQRTFCRTDGQAKEIYQTRQPWVYSM